jgi:hypothetical protein
MKATTIKLDGELLVALEKAKPPGASVTSYVKETLQKSLNAQRLREAAETYRTATEEDPEERAWLLEWDRADLVTPPKVRKSGRGTRS